MTGKAMQKARIRRHRPKSTIPAVSLRSVAINEVIMEVQVTKKLYRQARMTEL